LSDNPTVLVTGGAGFVGSHLVEALTARGHDVRVLVRPTTDRRNLDPARVTFVSGDVADPSAEAQAALVAAATGAAVVYHAAGITQAASAEQFERVNAGGAERMAVAAARAGVRRFVLVSSQAAAGPNPGPLPRTETDPDRPVGAYGRSKLLAEQRVARIAAEAAHGLEVVTIRPPAVYGPRDRAFLTLFRLVRTGIVPLHAPGAQTLSLIHARDLAQGLVGAAGHGTSGALYYVTDGTPVTSARLVDEIARALGKKPLRLDVPKRMLEAVVAAAEAWARATGRPARVTRERLADWIEPRWTLSDARARKEFAFAPHIALEAGIEETALWYRNAGWI
jgi:dihydroflavonol-4-reductase